MSACGELGKPPPSGITLTLTDSECTIDGVGALLQDHFDAVVVNKTSSIAAFLFHRLHDGHAYPELETYIKARSQKIVAGDAEAAACCPPPMTDVWASAFVKPTQTDAFAVELPAGSYGLVCRRDTPSNRAEAIYVLGPFRVV